MTDHKDRSNSIHAVILDWAGTTVDHGCMAPSAAFTRVFADRGVSVTVEQTRKPMGAHKRDHIRRMLEDPDVSQAWLQAVGRPATDADIQAMYEEGTAALHDTVLEHAELIEGCVEAIAAIRDRSIRVASTTGYPKELLDLVRQAAREQGYEPEVALAASEVARGRPAPDLCWTAAMRVDAPSAAACVKVGDTVVDILAGLNAGMWTVGVAGTGNELGLTAEGLRDADPALIEQARARLRAAGAHHVVDTIADLPAALDRIAAASGGPPASTR